MSDVRISSANDSDARHYRFERQSHLPIGYFRADPMDAFIRWRWLAIVVLVVALAVAGLTASDLPNF